MPREGGKVERGVQIPVEGHAARLALVHPLGQGQLGFRRAAS
jgi:hypothetical protein